ncbi:indole-3-glycerol phosphate synthase TrpC [Evansella sp. AB-P1]|uniref:indole-3-glycerol phosphate synthase TrpC n=1 Tax=Evansella sp. AB-P1 TaxID=3037653 RepID=UPI00241F8135|nr:indole-3-glycerol phosphate synthase TrpC [Evansella sp. AB-P1]MDG5787591.1 indole-3-glycerol phosphate synthase TrpC [Evansella sp. AB-P1]
MLDNIVNQKRQEIKEIQLQEKQTENFESRSFYQALLQPNRDLGIIAEVKKASPSKGVLVENFDPLAIAKTYEILGMDCISVLTDEKFFQGHPSYLSEIKRNISIPILRKDFIIDEKQIFQSKSIGADAILLIAAILDSNQLNEYMNVAEELELDVLIEVHDEDELEKVLHATKPKMIGVNNRDLKTFKTTLETSKRLADHIPDDVIFISESGIQTRQDIDYLREIHVNGLLVGEAFMINDNKKSILTEWFQEDNHEA